MSSNFIGKKLKTFFWIFILITSFARAQSYDKWKLQLAIGINDPIESDEKSPGYYTYYLNFPTINLGVQYMLLENLGVKLDYGFNRSSSGLDSQEFELNYSRVNAQLAYDFSSLLRFLPEEVGTVLHGGPGYSFSNPSGEFSENDYRFLNAILGAEIHYKVSRNLSVMSDLALVYSFSNENKYDINVDGFSFNDDLIYLTFGVSYALGRGCKCYP